MADVQGGNLYSSIDFYIAPGVCSVCVLFRFTSDKGIFSALVDLPFMCADDYWAYISSQNVRGSLLEKCLLVLHAPIAEKLSKLLF